MADTNKYIDPHYFAQNINAAREGALLAQLRRTKQAIDKLKTILDLMDESDSKYKEIESDLLLERADFYNTLALLDNVRSQIDIYNNSKPKYPFKQQIGYITERDFYTPKFMNVSNKDFNYMKSKISMSFSEPSETQKGSIFNGSAK